MVSPITASRPCALIRSRAEGYSAPIWITFRQARELGANVRKGEKGELVVYANTIVLTEKNANGDVVECAIPFMKG